MKAIDIKKPFCYSKCCVRSCTEKIIRTGPVYLVVWVHRSCLDQRDDIIET